MNKSRIGVKTESRLQITDLMGYFSPDYTP
jgi:hypothetical protein